MPSFLSGWSPTTCDHTAPRSGILGSNAGTSAGDGRTIELRIRTSRRGGGSARCSGSRARVSPTLSVHSRRRPKHLQRPAPSHIRHTLRVLREDAFRTWPPRPEPELGLPNCARLNSVRVTRPPPYIRKKLGRRAD